MKKILLLMILLVFSNACADKPDVKTLRLTTTTSVNDSGLLEYLRPYLLEEENISMDIVSLGSGAALEAGQRGDADVLLVHSPIAENTFIKDGYGIQRTSFMYNFFVVVGPTEDPAQIEGMSAIEAFKMIESNRAFFISRGDNSGTHSKEKALWKLAEYNYEELSVDTSFYISAGIGMGDTLMMASEKQAYTLTDLATYLSMKDKLNLEVLVDSGDDLKNTYSVIVINPNKVSNTDVETAKRFEAWMNQESTLDLIANYGIETYGQSLFFVE